MKTNKNRKRLFGMTLAAAVFILSPGCGTLLPPVEDQSRFYILDVPDYAAVSEAAPAEGLAVGVARVRVARYLEDPAIAIREGGTRIVFSQRHRWAESLEHGLGRLLTENLGQEPVVAQVLPLSDQRRPLPELDLHVSVSRAEGVLSREGGAEATFRADWELRSGVEREVVASGQVRADDLPWNGQDFDQLVASLSQGVAQLAQEVARAIEAF